MASPMDLPGATAPGMRRPIARSALARLLRTAAGLAVALLFLLTFLRLVNVSSVAQRLQHLRLGLALLCGLVFLGAYVVRALRWHWFLAPHRVGVRRVVAIYQVAIFVNWLLPVRGGELLKCLLLRRLDAIPISRSLPTVTMDKAMDLLPAVGLLVLLPFVPLHLSRALWVVLLTVLACLGLGALLLGLLLWRRQVALALLRGLMARLPGGMRQHLEPFVVRFVEALLALAVRPHLLVITAAYTAIAVGLDGLFCWLAFRAVGAALAVPVVLYGYTFHNLTYILPTPPGQIGSNELVGLLVFCGLFNINRAAVAAMFLFSHPWTALLMAGSGLLSLSALGLSVRQTLALAHSPGDRRQATEDGRRALRASPPHDSGRVGDPATRTATGLVLAKRSEPGMPVLVTGATGLLGSHLTDLLLERGEHVRVLLQRGDCVGAYGLRPFAHPNVEICWGDMGDHAALQAAVRGVDRVLHCAARTGPWGPQAAYEATNVRGLKTLVESALAAGIRRFVHVSSITVHGNDVHGTADETAPLRVEPNPYSRSKVAGERLLDRLIREQRAPITIVRPGWIYGPRDVASFARFAAMIQQGKMVLIGSGRNHLPLIYVRDVAQGLLLASEAPRAVGRAYLLVNDEPVTQHAYLAAIAAELGVPPPRRHMPYHPALLAGTAAEALGHLLHRQQPPPVMRYGVELLGGENRFDISRARHELGFSPQVPLADGVRQSVAWYRTTCEQGRRADARQEH